MFFIVGYLLSLQLGPQPGPRANMESFSRLSGGEGNGEIHAGFSDGLANGAENLSHAKYISFSDKSGVLYISLATDLFAGSNLQIR